MSATAQDSAESCGRQQKAISCSCLQFCAVLCGGLPPLRTPKQAPPARAPTAIVGEVRVGGSPQRGAQAIEQ
eukprot:3336452-Alexandrium_andersonii.AAC.1